MHSYSSALPKRIVGDAEFLVNEGLEIREIVVANLTHPYEINLLVNVRGDVSEP